MAKINQYTTQTTPAGPVAPGHIQSDANAGGVANIGKSLGTAAQVLYERGQQNDVAEVSNQISQAHVDFSTELAATIQNPPTDGTSLTENLDKKIADRIADIESNAATPEGAARAKVLGGRIRSHFLDNSMAAEAQIAGARAKSDIQTQINNYSSSMMVNPAKYIEAMTLAEDGIREQIRLHKLSPVDAEAILTHARREIAISSIVGYIKQNPQVAKKMISSGQYSSYIEGHVQESLLGAADAEQRRIDEEARRLKVEAQNKTYIMYMERLNVKGQKKLTVPEVLSPPPGVTRLEHKEVEHIIDLINGKDGPTDKDDPEVMLEVWTRMHLPDTDPNKIVDDRDLRPYELHGLSLQTLNSIMRPELRGEKDQEGVWAAAQIRKITAAATELLNPVKGNFGLRDPEGANRVAAFIGAFADAQMQKRKMGIPVRDLLTQGNKEYLGDLMYAFKGSNDAVAVAVDTQNPGIEHPLQSLPFAVKPDRVYPGAKAAYDALHGEGAYDAARVSQEAFGPYETGPNGRNAYDAVYGEGAWEKANKAQFKGNRSPQGVKTRLKDETPDEWWKRTRGH